MPSLNLESLLHTKQIIICCGSGGVGKTTVSAALGVHAALLGKKVLTLTVGDAYYWPQYSPVAHTTAAAIMGICVLVIAMVTICFPSRKPSPSGHCVHCGYGLTGNVSGNCPECGQEVSDRPGPSGDTEPGHEKRQK